MSKMNEIKSLAICLHGFENVTSTEIKELTGYECEAIKGAVRFTAKDMKDLFRLCYRAQSVYRLLIGLGECEVSDSFDKTCENIKDLVENAEFSKWLKGDTNFKVFCKRTGEHKFSSQDLARYIGGLVVKKTSATVEMEEPQLRIYFYVNDNKGYLGIDLAGFDLGKREYKIFSNRREINSVVAYAMLRKAAISTGDVVLDPYCLSSTIAIEAALLAKHMSPHYYKKNDFAFVDNPVFKEYDPGKIFDEEDAKIEDEPKFAVFAYDEKLENITASKKNAKIAGVHKAINFSRQPTGWLDTKFDEGEITRIVTQPPHLMKHENNKKIRDEYKEFFYQADFILNESGKLCLLTRNPEELKNAAQENYMIKAEHDLVRGKEEYSLLVLESRKNP